MPQDEEQTRHVEQRDLPQQKDFLLVVTSATLVVTGAVLLVTRSY